MRRYLLVEILAVIGLMAVSFLVYFLAFSPITTDDAVKPPTLSEPGLALEEVGRAKMNFRPWGYAHVSAIRVGKVDCLLLVKSNASAISCDWTKGGSL